MNEQISVLCGLCLHKCQTEDILICKKFIPNETARSFQYGQHVSVQPLPKEKQRHDR